MNCHYNHWVLVGLARAFEVLRSWVQTLMLLGCVSFPLLLTNIGKMKKELSL